MKKITLIAAIIFSVSAFAQEMKVHKTNGNVESYLLSQIDSITFTSSTIPTDMIAYYPFNGNANDESGNGNDGIVSGATLTSDRFGNSNSAFNFDGIDNYINVESSNHPTGNVTITYSAWIYYTATMSVGQHVSVVDVGEAGDMYPNKRSAILLWKNTDNNDYITYSTQVNDIAFLNYIFPSNEWLHIVITKSDQIVALYINGIFAEQGSIDPGQNVENTHISIGYNGNFSHHNGECFKGNIDDVRIYNRVLSDSEIQALYNEGD
jgi:hypothetical protein